MVLFGFYLRGFALICLSFGWAFNALLKQGRIEALLGVYKGHILERIDRLKDLDVRMGILLENAFIQEYTQNESYYIYIILDNSESKILNIAHNLPIALENLLKSSILRQPNLGLSKALFILVDAILTKVRHKLIEERKTINNTLKTALLCFVIIVLCCCNWFTSKEEVEKSVFQRITNKLMEINRADKHDNHNDYCIICFEDLSKDIFKGICLHRFHMECIANWTKRENACPICRKELIQDYEDIIDVHSFTFEANGINTASI